MRLQDQKPQISAEYKIIVIDDEIGVIESVKVLVESKNYEVVGITDPQKGIEQIRNEEFDLLVLDYFMEPFNGDQVVKEIRRFNQELYILMLTGYQDLASPVETLNCLDIQGYCEKGDKLEHLYLLIESAFKSVKQTRMIKKFHQGLDGILNVTPEIFELKSIETLLQNILMHLANIADIEDGLLFLDKKIMSHKTDELERDYIFGIGKYGLEKNELYTLIDRELPGLTDDLINYEITEWQNGIIIPLFNQMNHWIASVFFEKKINFEKIKLIEIFIKNAQTSLNNTILHSLISRKNSELQTALNQLEDNVKLQKKLEQELRQTQKMEALGKLAGGIAHDFNNLLTIIIGYTEILLESVQTQDPLYEPTKTIKNASDRAVDLVRQLLAFSRKQVQKSDVYNLNELIQTFYKMLTRILGSLITIELDLDENIWTTYVDKSQIEQILLNLLINAKDSMPGGGKILISTGNISQEEIEKFNKKEIVKDDYVILSIKDSGHGIPTEIISRIFEPFFTTKGVGKGTGLGLSTVYGIVKQSNGYIYVESELSKGTVFKLFFPKSKVEKKQISAITEQQIVIGNETILIVEDQKELLEYIKYVLVNHGYHILTALNGFEAMQVFNNNSNIDLVLTDIIMPAMNGRELCAELRKKNEKQKIIFMSGFINEELNKFGFFYSEKYFIEKPFSPNFLLKKIRTVLNEI